MWRHDRSWVENILSSRVFLLLAVMAVTSLGLRYVTDPISCHYVYPQANEYFGKDCFRQTSVLMRSREFVQFSKQTWASSSGRGLGGRGRNNQNFPNPFKLWPKQRTYHHWVPFALGMGALLCLLPDLIWRVLNSLLWLDSHVLLNSLAAAAGMPESSKDSSGSGSGPPLMVKDSAVLVQAALRKGNWLLTAAALTRKGATCAMCALQMVLIAVVFRPPLGGAWGQEEEVETEVGDPVKNVTVPESLEDIPLPVDPFFCTLEFTHNQNSQTMTMQCLLPLNQVFTKEFVFLFYLFLLLLLLSVGDLIYWMGRLFMPRVRDLALIRHLSIISQSESDISPSPAATGLLYIFAETLGPDGRLLLALAADHCGPVSCLQFTRQLWQAFKGQSSVVSHPVDLSPAHDVDGGVTSKEDIADLDPHPHAGLDPRTTADDIPLDPVDVLRSTEDPASFL